MSWMNRLKKADGLDGLLITNALVFLVVQLLLAGLRMSGNSYFAEEHKDLFLAAGGNLEMLLQRPWSVVTHMFVHVNFGHFIFNMFALYTAGKLFRHFADARKLVSLYLLGGFSGFLFFVFYNRFFGTPGVTEYYLGASAAVMAVVLAIGTLRPDFTIRLFGVFEMRLILLCGILILVDLISLRKGFNSGGHIGHLGGALFGWYYALNYKKGKNMASWLDRILQKITSLFSGTSHSAQTQHRRPKTDDEFNAERMKRQQRVDQILDKINRSGYESLSKEEKDFLFRYSQK